MDYPYEWCTAVPKDSTEVGDEFAYEVIRAARPGVRKDYTEVFGTDYMSADGENPTHSVAKILANETMRKRALELLRLEPYQSTLLFRVIRRTGKLPNDPTYYIDGTVEDAYKSMGLYNLPETGALE